MTERTRLPFQPLEDLLGVSSDRALAETLQMSGRRLRDARERGLDPWTADRCATRAGYHPITVWGDMWVRLVDHEIALTLDFAEAV
jgi:hypothetical protein